MTPIKTIGTIFLFFSLPIIASLKGKGIVVSLLLSFFLFNGIDALKQFIRHQTWKSFLSGKRGLGIAIFVIITLSPILKNPHTLFHLLRVVVLGFIVFFTAQGALTLSKEEKEKIKRLFFQAYIVYGLFLLIELYGGSWISKLFTESKGYNENLFIRGIVILTFFFLPFSWLISQYYKGSQRIFLLTISFLILGFILVKAQPSAARLAVGISALFFILSFRWKKAGFFIMGGVTIYLLMMPFISLYGFNRETLFHHMHHMPTSYQHRVEIWHETAQHILEKPFFGHGFDYAAQLKESPHLCLHHPESAYRNIISRKNILSTTPYPWGAVVCYAENIFTTHPHNGALQIWLEFGLWGIILTCFLLYKFKGFADSHSPLQRGYLYGLLGIGFVYWNVSFGIWQNWMIALAALTFTLFQIIKGLPSDKRETINV